jgi:Cu2+-exporting ATPase
MLNTKESLHPCKHCGLEVKETNQEFCCKGCELAYKIINKLGLSNYYQMRLISGEERNIKPDLKDFIDITEFVEEIPENTYQISLAVTGIHCAACVWLIENILKKQPHVTYVRLNLSKKRLNLKWVGAKEYGNDLIKIIFKIGYKLYPLDSKLIEEEDKKYNNELIRALGIAGFGVGNIMLFSVILWFSNPENIGINTRNLLHFLSALIGLPVVIYAARPFFKSALKAFKARTTNMDVTISVAIILSSIVSLIESFRSSWDIYFDSAVMLVFFLLIGRYFDYKVRKKVFNVAADFSMLAASFGKIEINNKAKIISVKEIKPGMILLVAPGEKIVADGLIIDGESEIDSSLITGESLPKFNNLGSRVYSGTINLSNPLKIEVTQIGSESLLGKIIALIENFENSKNSYIRLADRLAKFYTPLVHLFALTGFLLWYFYFQKGWEIALINATSVLIITCPCALALAVPIVQIIAHYQLIKRAILVKSGEALERLDNIKTIIFDKTGSLTEGSLKLNEIMLIKNNQKITLNDQEKYSYLQIAASLSKVSRHPISKAISAAFSDELKDLKVEEKPGFGLQAIIKEDLKIEVKIGRKEFCFDDFMQMNFEQILDDPQYSCCFMKFADKKLILLFSDLLKSDADSVIKELYALKKEVILLSGDSKQIVENIAFKLGIKEFYFEQTPLQKSELILKKREQSKVLMVGDGLNDAPAIALADVSISFSKAYDITKNAADIIIQGEKLMPIITAVKIADKTLKLMKQNLILALIYNLVAVPFALLGHVTPLIAAAAMSSSSLIVLLNSLRAKKI